MDRKLKNAVVLLVICLMMTTGFSSCFVQRSQVGEGPQQNITVKKKNHYLFYGIVPITRANTQKMANGQEDYQITNKHNGWDIFFWWITGGIYTPTTTKVER